MFISYSHDSDVHAAAVCDLARLARTWGVDVALDNDVQHPEDGWAQWSLSQLAEADVTLMVCTETYRRRVEQQEVPGRGRGATWEGRLLTEMVYDGPKAFARIGIVLLGGATLDAVPRGFRTAPHYQLPADAERLRSWVARPIRDAEAGEGDARIEREARVPDELSLYAKPAERELAAYLRDLEELRDFGASDDESSARQELEQRIVEVRRQIRTGPLLDPGQSLDDGTYVLVRELGTGGFGSVWLANDTKVRRQVAIKLLKQEHLNDRNRRARFFRGARVMASFEHPNIARVYDAGRVDAGHHYFVMEYVKKGDLSALVKSGKLELSAAVSVIRLMAEALYTAHQRGVIHRDVKPANILIDDKGVPKLTDFDLVYAGDTTGGTLPEPMGTYLYSSPEALADASSIDARADVYSLGMSLLYCAAGGRLTIAAKHTVGRVLQSLELPQQLKAIVARATDSEPESRYESMKALAADIALLEKAWGATTAPIPRTPPTHAMLRSLARVSESLPLIATPSTLGRGPRSDLRLARPEVSAQHAEFYWSGQAWLVRDLGSRNGTYVDQRRLLPREATELREGAIIAFGNKVEAWELVAALPPPEVAAVNEATGEVLLVEEGAILLPNPNGAAAVVMRGLDGWLCEEEFGTRPLVDGSTVDVGTKMWLIRINAAGEKFDTAAPGNVLRVREVSLQFRVSSDEEHVELRVHVEGRTIDLPARSYNYLLLVLARRWLEEESYGRAESSRGWMYIEDLERGLGTPQPRLNVDVHRIRAQFAKIGLSDAASIIERRTRTQQIRIGTGKLSVERL